MKIKLPNLQEWKGRLQQKSHLLFIVGLVSFLVWTLVSFVTDHLRASAANTADSASMESPDTVIPKGFVLVPIELKNAESLSALIENFAIVDLYASSLDGKNKGKRVGHQLRLLRAPLNPNTFAVLVPDNEANTLVNGSGPLVAVVQNRDHAGHGGLEKNPKKINRVQYYHGG